MSASTTHPPANRLAGETSPYLLQHAHNPVDWYPWGPEALARAREEDRPIFLSIGYAACHWCHVMERESFENEAIARVVNEHFVPIKVDREERPDLDEIYMTATQLLTQHGGWPMSVWLTPDLKPFYAGTYFPPEDGVYGRIGFRTLCLELARAWRERRGEVLAAADDIVAAMQPYLGARGAAPGGEFPADLVERAVRGFWRDYDSDHGGFGGAPKFPPSQRLALIVRAYRRDPEPRLRQMLAVTLDRMARGGMYDQLGGGFHRYSVDASWLVPHFEKMLYDNAQLAWVYLDAGEVLGEPGFHRSARQVLDDVLREFRHPDGGFYSTMDADSEGEEGKYYVWKPEEVTDALGEADGEFFNALFDITASGNFEGQNIPNLLKRSLPEWAAELGVPRPELEARVDRLRGQLLAVRDRRVPPGLDDKILTAWNGLMIRAFARGYELLGEPRYLQAAQGAAEFVLTRLRRDGRLLVTYREGEANLNAYLDDYAFMAVGLLHLHAASGEARWLEEARSLVNTLNRHFWDEEGGGYFFTSHDHEALIARSRGGQDSAIPAGNGMAALALAWLAHLTGVEEYRERAARTLSPYRAEMEQFPAAYATMLHALDVLQHGPGGLAAPGAAIAVEVAGPSQAVRPGQSFRVAITLAVPPGWHLNSHMPDEGTLIPTAVRFDSIEGLRLQEIQYPPPTRIEVGFSGQPLSAFEGDVRIEAVFAAEHDLPPGDYPLRAAITYQPCSESECLAPVEVERTIEIRVG